MSKRTELQVMEQTIAIPGVRFTRTSMIFERLEEATLVAAGAFLQAVDECGAWWRGDHLAAYCGYNIGLEEKENGRAFDELTKQDKLKQYTSRYATTWNREPKTLHGYLAMSRFYNLDCRQSELSWSHHWEAAVGARGEGDLATAQNWLDLAMKHRWSVSELRAAIRNAKRAEAATAEPAAQMLLPVELVNCRRFVCAHIASVADMDIEDARAQLAELEQVHAYIVALTRRVSASLSLLPTPRGKESLTA
jgi:hypothetical protein